MSVEVFLRSWQSTEERYLPLVTSISMLMFKVMLTARNFFTSLINAFDYTQFVKDQTHKHSHMLDLLITRSEDNLVHKLAISVPNMSDHGAVHCKIMPAKQPFQKKEIKCRTQS